MGEFRDPFGCEAKFNAFFTRLPGVKLVRPNLRFYKGADKVKRFGYDSDFDKVGLFRKYEEIKAFGYEFEKEGEKCFFCFSHRKKLPNPFNKDAWE